MASIHVFLVWLVVSLKGRKYPINHRTRSHRKTCWKLYQEKGNLSMFEDTNFIDGQTIHQHVLALEILEISDFPFLFLHSEYIGGVW